MAGCRRFTAAALEVHDRYDLQGFRAAPVGHVFLEIRAPVPVEVLAQLKHLFGTISAPARDRRGRGRAFAFQVELFDVGGRDAEKVSHL